MKYTTLAIALCSTFAFTSCDKQTSTSKVEAKTTTEAPAQSTIESIIADSMPGNAYDIFEAQNTAKIGEEITIAGKVMGRKDPFVEGRAMLVLGDPNKISSCDGCSDDGCPTPWDVCCDDPEMIKQSVATVQVVDDAGKLIKQGLKGVAGIAELSELVVTGTVAEGSSEDNLILNASSIYVQP